MCSLHIQFNIKLSFINTVTSGLHSIYSLNQLSYLRMQEDPSNWTKRLDVTEKRLFAKGQRVISSTGAKIHPTPSSV